MQPKTSLFSAFANFARFLFWALLIFIVIYHWIGASSLQDKRKAALDAIQNERGNRVITLDLQINGPLPSDRLPAPGSGLCTPAETDPDRRTRKSSGLTAASV